MSKTIQVILVTIAILLMGGNAMAMKITTTAFNNGDKIPAQYTCDGTDISPVLKWSEVPKGTQSICLIMYDPDAPKGTWTHWVIYNIPPDVKELAENTPKTETLSSGALQGTNDFGKIGYNGPCPPTGPEHRYYFKIYALDTKIAPPAKPNKKQIDDAITGHIIEKTQLMGFYGK